MAAHAEALGFASGMERGRSLADRALTVCLVGLTLGLVAVIAFLMTGGRAFIVRSGSMAPAIDTGDVIVTQTIPASDVNVGDVITFSDPTREGDLVTHRARRMESHGSRIEFVTKGDANGGVERWTIADDGTVGRVVGHAPGFGYVLSWAAEPQTRFALLVMGSVLLAYSVLRRIWAE